MGRPCRRRAEQVQVEFSNYISKKKQSVTLTTVTGLIKVSRPSVFQKILSFKKSSGMALLCACLLCFNTDIIILDQMTSSSGGGDRGKYETRDEEEEEPTPRPEERSKHSYGKRTAPAEEDDASERGSCSSSGGKRQNRSDGSRPSGNELPESFPAYVLHSILSNLSNTIGDRAGEASAKLRRVEDELEQQRRLTLIETAKTAAAEREQRRIAEEARKSKVVLFVFVFYDYVGGGFAVTVLDFFFADGRCRDICQAVG
jgi:hypothetical protein